MSVVNLRTLVLSQNYMPVSVFPLYTIPSQDAITRYLNRNCDVVFWYDRPILTQSRHDLYWPSVIVNYNTRSFRNEVRLKKSTLYYRDHCVCYWCDAELSVGSLTYDHLTPKSRGGKHEWENVVASCEKCNIEKGNSLPKGRWEPKKYLPYRPSFFQLLDIRKRYPIVVDDESWAQFLPGFASDRVIVKRCSSNNVVSMVA